MQGLRSIQLRLHLLLNLVSVYGVTARMRMRVSVPVVVASCINGSAL
jgi:hypothetical protein